ncbi:ABC transporter ATP-binding protein, partial [Frankia sp. AgB1.9]|nr:ABC transporter ATP-binding protein [Frankia sp. AgB1.9]
IATRPDLVLADEPTGALDTAASRRVVELLREEHRRGQTLIMVTHDYAVAAAADRVIFLRDGQIIDERRPAGRRAGDSPPAGPNGALDADEAGETSLHEAADELVAEDGVDGTRGAPGGSDLNDLLGLGSW